MASKLRQVDRFCEVAPPSLPQSAPLALLLPPPTFSSGLSLPALPHVLPLPRLSVRLCAGPGACSPGFEPRLRPQAEGRRHGGRQGIPHLCHARLPFLRGRRGRGPRQQGGDNHGRRHSAGAGLLVPLEPPHSHCASILPPSTSDICPPSLQNTDWHPPINLISDKDNMPESFARATETLGSFRKNPSPSASFLNRLKLPFRPRSDASLLRSSASLLPPLATGCEWDQGGCCLHRLKASPDPFWRQPRQATPAPISSRAAPFASMVLRAPSRSPLCLLC